MDKNPTNVFPNSFPRRQNCKTALVEKIPKEPVTFFFCFISAIYPILLYTPSNFGLFLLSFHDTSRVLGTGGISDYYSQLPNLCFQLLSKHLCSALFPSSVRVPEKRQSHTVLFYSKSKTSALQHLWFLCLEKHFVCTKSLLLKFEKSATRTGSWRGFFFICNPLLHFHRLVVLENSRDASAPKHSNVSELRELLWWCLQTHCEDNDLPTTSAFSAKSPCFHYVLPHNTIEIWKWKSIFLGRLWNHLIGSKMSSVCHTTVTYFEQNWLLNWLISAAAALLPLVCQIWDLCYWCI